MHRSLNLFSSLCRQLSSLQEISGTQGFLQTLQRSAWSRDSYLMFLEVSSQPTHNSTRVFQIKLLYFKDSPPPPPPSLQSRLFNLIYASGAHNSGSVTFLVSGFWWLICNIYLTFKICWKIDLEVLYQWLVCGSGYNRVSLSGSWPPDASSALIPPTNLAFLIIFDVR